MPPEDKQRDLSLPQQIYILGPQRLQNRLFAHFLAQHTGLTCDEAETFEQIFNTDGSDHPPALLLWDCNGLCDEDLFIELNRRQNVILHHHYLALFNVEPAFSHEEKTVDQGIRGFFYIEDTPDHILKGVKAILSDELWVSRGILTKCILENQNKKNPAITDKNPLTTRETEILALIASGATNEEISDKLCISPNTVRTHIYNIFKKIDVPNRLQATLWAIQYL